MESKPVSTKQKESLVIILIDNVPVSISTDQYNHLLEWIDRYHRYQIGMEIYPLESNIYKQYAIKSKIALETLKSLKMNYKMTINNKIDYIKKVLKIAEKTENSAQLKYLFKVIEIELP